MGDLILQDSGLLRDRAFIDGAWVAADDGATFTVDDPANGRRLAEVASMEAAAARRAIAAAAAAFPAWSELTAKERATVLRRWHDLILENRDDLSLLLMREQGKPHAEASSEVVHGAAYIAWYAEEAKRVYGGVIPTYANDRRLVTLKRPLGVVAAITPWNFPHSMVARKAGPALAAGCTLVVKPAAETPLSALALAELARRAGVPAGVFNVVPTARTEAVGAELTGSPLVRKLSFTGSTAVGKMLMAQCAGSVKKLALELGGNAPFIVFEDADLEEAVAAAIATKFRNAGQTCVCTNRIYVQAGVYDAFVERFAARAAELRLGPLIDRAAVERMERLIADARAKGARVALGGSRTGADGHFFAPTVLCETSDAMAVSREEIFGPLAGIARFETEEEVVARANDTGYGLAAYYFTRDAARVWRLSERLEFGIVTSNTGIFSSEAAPFGGVKESGIGREGGREGIEEFVEVKYHCVGGLAR